jgi:glutamate synthase domain-containing protein 3
MPDFDLDISSVRDLNTALHAEGATVSESWSISNTKGRHNIACGLDEAFDVSVMGHVGYYFAGMNKSANVVVEGNCGVGVAENIMSGTVRIKGDASQSAGATGCGGLLVIEGNASARCGISMKGVDIVVGGNVGHMACFMGQAGSLVVCGDAGDALGDSLYEAHIYVRGSVKSLGADCIEKEIRDQHRQELAKLLDRAGYSYDVSEFTRYGSARKLYNFDIDNVGEY